KTSIVRWAARLHAGNERTAHVIGSLKLSACVRVQISEADSPAGLTFRMVRAFLIAAFTLSQFLDGDRQSETLSIAQHLEFNFLARLLLADFHLQLASICYFVSIDLGDHVADLKPGFRARSVRFHLRDHCAGSFRHLEELGVLRRDVRDAHSDVGMTNLSVSD